MNKGRLASSFKKTLRAFSNALPVIVGMLLLTSLAITLLPVETVSGWFGKADFVDVMAGAGIGSIAAGHPLVSYLLGGELLAGGVSLLAVTTLIVSWVTVGIVQLPAEMLLLGRRFAIVRNVISFMLAIAVALLTVYTLQLLN